MLASTSKGKGERYLMTLEALFIGEVRPTLSKRVYIRAEL